MENKPFQWFHRKNFMGIADHVEHIVWVEKPFIAYLIYSQCAILQYSDLWIFLSGSLNVILQKYFLGEICFFVCM